MLPVTVPPGLLLCRSHAAVLAAMALTGAGRGVNAVFLQLLIPDNVPLARLPSAQGFYLLTNGVLITVLGSGMSTESTAATLRYRRCPHNT